MRHATAFGLLLKNASGNGNSMALRNHSSDDRLLAGRQKFDTQQVALSRQQLIEVHALFLEVRGLLEEYGPTWYSEELSEKLASMLTTLEDEL